MKDLVYYQVDLREYFFSMTLTAFILYSFFKPTHLSKADDGNSVLARFIHQSFSKHCNY